MLKLNDHYREERMSEQIERRGRCLCGAVQFTVNTAANEIGACHCKMCRRWCGGPLMAMDCGVSLDISGEESITNAIVHNKTRTLA